MAGPSLDEPRSSNSIDGIAEMGAPAGAQSGPGAPPMNAEAVNRVMYSDIGINVLLNRLKQSIASARDFSSFLSKRARLEDEHAQGLKKLSRATLEGVKRQDGRQGTYASQFSSVCTAHDRMADHGTQFANSLHQMHQDIDEITARIDRDRKHWKQEGLNTEKKVKDAESALEKAKVRYDTLADDYDKVRTGGGTSGRVFTVKGPKSAEKHEEDLNRKVQAADQEYQGKVQSAQSARQENLNAWRPKAVKTIQELIFECDSALTLQLQKFAAFNEKLIVGNGLAVSPVPGASDSSGPPSMREVVQQIDNDRDFHNYMVSNANNVPGPAPDITYQKHPTLGGSYQPPSLQTPTANKRSSFQSSPQTNQSPTAFAAAQAPTSSYSMPSQPPPVSSQVPPQSQPQPSVMSGPYSTSSPSSAQGPPSYQQGRTQGTPVSSLRGAPQQSQYPPASGSSPAYGAAPSQALQQQQQYPPSGPSSGYGGAGAPPANNAPYSSSAPAYREAPRQQSQGQGYPPNGSYANQSQPPPQQQQQQQQQQSVAPTRPVFGQHLDYLFKRDDAAIPYVVLQCCTAVEMYGLEVEGIYRLSGNSAHIAQLKAVFDNDTNPPDFRDPQAFQHDINSVAGLLKQFFRELPDPLFTAQFYAQFIDAARIDDDDARRDSIHGIINGLPDPNYATMRHMVLHLNRVIEREQVNRMTTHNLAICFAPTLMGQHTGPQMADAGLQARVLDTVLRSTYQIFDED